MAYRLLCDVEHAKVVPRCPAHQKPPYNGLSAIDNHRLYYLRVFSQKIWGLYAQEKILAYWQFVSVLLDQVTEGLFLPY